MEVKCSYCGKNLEPTPSRIAAVKKGSKVYCNEDCKMRSKALERGVTEDKIVEVLERIGSATTLDYLLRELNVRDSDGKKAVMWLISSMKSSGRVSVEKIGDKTVISLVREVKQVEDFENLVQRVEEQVSGRMSEVEKRLEELTSRVSRVEEQIDVLNRKADVLKRAIEVIANALSGRVEDGDERSS